MVEPFEDRPKLSVARKAITDYKKANGNVNGLLELILHYLDCGAFMATKYGYYENGFYSSMLSMFKSAIRVIKKSDGEADKYLNDLSKIAKRCAPVGWEFEVLL